LVQDYYRNFTNSLRLLDIVFAVQDRQLHILWTDIKQSLNRLTTM